MSGKTQKATTAIGDEILSPLAPKSLISGSDKSSRVNNNVTTRKLRNRSWSDNNGITDQKHEHSSRSNSPVFAVKSKPSDDVPNDILRSQKCSPEKILTNGDKSSESSQDIAKSPDPSNLKVIRTSRRKSEPVNHNNTNGGSENGFISGCSSRNSSPLPKKENSKSFDEGKTVEKSSQVSEPSGTPLSLQIPIEKNDIDSSITILNDERSSNPAFAADLNDTANDDPTGEKNSSFDSVFSDPQTSPTRQPKIIKKGDTVITSYVDEETGKISVYEPGIKLEVRDFGIDKWYSAKVLEVDVDENEVLVHYEKWSARFDEWIKMDSNRIRPSVNTNIVK